MLSITAHAQERCFKAYADPNYIVEITSFCVGQTVYFKDCAGVDADKEYYDYDKKNGVDFSTVEAKQKSYKFTVPGPVTVTQFANLEGVSDSFERSFIVVDTPIPTFTTIACANRTFTITITDTNYDFYIVRFGDNQSKVVYKTATGIAPIVHKYAKDGPHQITVTGGYAGGTCTSPIARQTATDLPDYSAPAIATLKVQTQDAIAGRIDFTFNNLLQGYTYTLKSKTEQETNYKTVANISQNQATYTLTNSNTTSTTEYILEATDACGTALPASAIFNNIPLTTSGGNEQVTITWNGKTGQYRQYELFRNGALLQTLPGNALTFTDTDVRCGQQVCYEVKGISADGKSTSVSVQSCISVTSTITPKAGNLFTTFNLQNEVELTFQLPNGEILKSATYQRSLNSTPFTDLTTSEQLTLTDKPGTATPACYRATFINPCGITSAVSSPSCPIILTIMQNPDESANLTWTSYTGFPDGVASYSLETLDESGNVLKTITVRANAQAVRLADEQEQIFRYRIKATSKSNVVTYSNNETIKLEYALYVPSGFTPNGDGLNDLFEVKGKRFEGFSIRVISGLGQVVYSSEDRTSGWDGAFNGKPQPAGIYAYEVILKLQDGTTKRRTGTVTLIR
ncbi:gliding motility-associated C-terminal domain-containing protein [Pontibacter sp. BT310]|uniref:Gliding motility-associated C-terminal domain-containing protein n=1 Tax=Pontibacter populi TaxID=890055 RepID=A0ABS6XBA2_9BACT|nr:gliding motility-associated C-terminal domain-containing protein [Pontibacter populi]MBJ6118433.1 gliding motility-associated C-terminal domain-containing protein [Pontibacter sp. BT310]MBR0570861.1 gliding motility-associated C-terminal domain-containing protein [Microvirga sp. STS03]MBW3365287.1 gliding motility-associated C-terminal domain-containing protein [Pontibacter populi]